MKICTNKHRKGFFRCTCGKFHTYGGVTQTTKCACGKDLWRYTN